MITARRLPTLKTRTKNVRQPYHSHWNTVVMTRLEMFSGRRAAGDS